MSVLAVILVLALLIVVHELGHFLAARLQGIHVNRFSIGFGPILLKYQGPQTEYAIRAFPLGGFVGFPDDDPDSDIPPDDPNLLRNRPVLDRAIVISAGVIANFILAYLVLVLQVGIFGVPNFQPGVKVIELPTQNSPAVIAGIQAGDIVLAVNDRPLPASEASADQLTQLIKSSPNQTLKVDIQRQQQKLTVQLTPKPGADGVGRIGVKLSPYLGTPIYRHTSNPVELLGRASEQFQELVVRTAQGFGQLVTHFQETVGQVAGPVGIVEQGAKFAKADSANLLVFAAVVSVNLAIINILPLPALDGGQLAFLLIEGLLGRPLPTKFQESVMQTGLVLLLGLGIFLIIRDTTQLEGVQRLFQ